MTGRERLLAALDRRPTDCVAAAPFYLSLYLRPFVHRFTAEAYVGFLGDRQERPVTFEDDLALRTAAWTRAFDLFDFPSDLMPLPTGSGRAPFEGASIRREGDDLVLLRARGGREVLSRPFSDAAPPAWEGQARPEELDLDRLMPLWDAASWLDPGHLELPRRLLASWGDRCLLAPILSAPFPGTYALLGFEEGMIAVRERPDLAREICERKLRNGLEFCRALRQIGVEAVFVEEWLASSDIISPPQYEELAWPYEQRLLQGIRDLGLKSIFYFCGGVEDRLALLRELPAEALGFEEPKKAYDLRLERLRQELSEEVVLVGNLDVVFLRDAPREAIRKDVVRQNAVAGPRFIAGVGSPITLDTPPHRVDWLVEATRDLRP